MPHLKTQKAKHNLRVYLICFNLYLYTVMKLVQRLYKFHLKTFSDDHVRFLDIDSSSFGVFGFKHLAHSHYYYGLAIFFSNL